MGSKDKSSHAWLMLTKETRQHSGNLGYDDSSAEHYSWDNTVPNHLKPKVHDKIVIWDGKTLIGASVIQNIVVDVGEKIRLRCPFCSATDFHERYKILPRYRCRTQSCKNEFDSPDEEIIAVTTFKSYHSNFWYDLEGQLDPRELRSICVQTKSQHSLRLLDWQKFLKSIGRNFSQNFMQDKHIPNTLDQNPMVREPDAESLKTFYEDLMDKCASVATQRGDTTIFNEFLKLQLNQLSGNEKDSEFQVIKSEYSRVNLPLFAIRRDQVSEVSLVFQLFSDEVYQRLKKLSKNEINRFKQKVQKFLTDCVSKLPQEISGNNRDLFQIAAEIKENWSNYKTINILILTNRPAEANNFAYKDEEKSRKFNTLVYDLKSFYKDQEKSDKDTILTIPPVHSVKKKSKEISSTSTKETKKITETRNVKWSREEIIITLDFYFKEYPNIPDKNSTKIKTLSNLLRSNRLKTDSEMNSKYRNSAGVYMKLMNFNNINPEYKGKGLNAGSKLDREIFMEFRDSSKELTKLAKMFKGDEKKRVENKAKGISKTCPKCNKEYQETFLACPNCGEKAFYLGFPPSRREVSKSIKTTIFGRIISWFIS